MQRENREARLAGELEEAALAQVGDLGTEGGVLGGERIALGLELREGVGRVIQRAVVELEGGDLRAELFAGQGDEHGQGAQRDRAAGAGIKEGGARQIGVDRELRLATKSVE